MDIYIINYIPYIIVRWDEEKMGKAGRGSYLVSYNYYRLKNTNFSKIFLLR